MHTITNIYKSYEAETESPLDKALFKEIVEKFNISIMEHILEGGVFNMKHNLSKLSIIRIERNPSAPTVDWVESNKYKKELLAQGKELYDAETGKGEKWFIYYTDPWYCRYYWEKSKCKIPNKTAYKFTPTRGLKGNKEKLTALLKSDDLAYLRFKTDGNL